MIDTLNFTNIRVVADRLMRHPLLQHLLFESIIRYTIDFLSLLGFNELYLLNTGEFEVVDNKTILPKTLIRIENVKTSNNVYLKAMTSSFSGSLENPAYKVLGNVLYTNIPKCTLLIEYRELPIDIDGYPMVLDNIHFLMALEAFIKMQVFTMYFDEGKININVLQQAQQDYSFRVAQLHSKMSLPTIQEMQAISNMWNKMHLTSKDFYNGFATTTNTDTYKIH